MASAAKPTGAIAAIQSQWTNRPKRGLMVALASMDTPTTTATQNNENVQLRAVGSFEPPREACFRRDLFANRYQPPSSAPDIRRRERRLNRRYVLRLGADYGGEIQLPHISLAPPRNAARTRNTRHPRGWRLR